MGNFPEPEYKMEQPVKPWYLERIAQLEAQLREREQEIEIAYRTIKGAEGLMDLAYVDADGETPNPETWKQRAEDLEAENASLEAQVAALGKPVTIIFPDLLERWSVGSSAPVLPRKANDKTRQT